MGKHFDIMIVGGGVTGCAAAYYLMKADHALSVGVIEKDSSYQYNSTVLSDGNIRLQFNLKENIEISLYGLQKLSTFEEEMAVGEWRPKIEFRQQGNLFTSDEENKADAMAGLKLQESLDCQVRWLEPQEIAARFPLIDAAQIAGGAFGALDGTMDPYAVLMGYRNKAADLGAAFIEAEAASVLKRGNQTTGVRLTDGTEIASEQVINCAGAWGTQFAQTAGIDLPVEPVMRNVFNVEVQAQVDDIYPLTVFPSGLYIVQEHGGRFMTSRSYDDDPVGFDFRLNKHTFEERIWPELVTYMPAFDRLKLTGGWAGLYAVNRFDGNALLGEWPELNGFYLCNGFSGHGFQQCHAVGRYLSELVLGTGHQLDLSIFSPKRLLENKPVFEGHRKLV